MSVKDLDLALDLGNLEAVRQLLLSLSQDRILNKEPASLIHMAISIGHIRSVAYLLENLPNEIDSDIRDSWHGWTPLMYSIAYNDLDIIRYLVSTKRFDINARNFNDQTVLHIGAMSKETLSDIITMLVENGANTAAEDASLRTPFLRAVEENNLLVAQTFYSLNCNIQKLTCDHRNALHLAVTSSDNRMVQWLIEIGCNYNAVDINQQTPLMVLVQTKQPPTMLHQIMTSLVLAGVSVNQQDANGYSVFLHAINNPLNISKQHIQYLIDSGADINLTDNTGLSPLWQAVFDGGHYPDRSEIVRLLVANNCQLDAECCGKLLFTTGHHRIYCYETPLSPFEVALDSNCYSIARLLFYAGCHISPEVRYDYYQLSVGSDELIWLKQAIQNAHSLRHLCCITVRKSLGERIHLKVQCLPIPCMLKSYILLEDLPFTF